MLYEEATISMISMMYTEYVVMDGQESQKRLKQLQVKPDAE